ncbi:MAG: DUF1292 domain-containing protein [Clostridia bacterium]|nr:DUF1292 domain-containing protein [Clostridia bacterium]
MKKFLKVLSRNVLKLLIASVVLFIVAAILGNSMSGSPLVTVFGLLFFLMLTLAIVGFIAKIVFALARGVKKIGNSVKKTFHKDARGKKVKKNKNPNANNKDDIVTLKSANGEDIDFIEIAGIAYKGNFYAILQPVELLEGMSDDEALVFKVTRGNDGSDSFAIELDDNVIDAVFAEYDKLLAAENAKNAPAPKPAQPAADGDDDNIITLKSANGEDIEFVEIAGIAYKGNFYAILQPVELLEGMGEDEALVFKVTQAADGSNNFEIEQNETIIDAVFAEYDKLLAQS